MVAAKITRTTPAMAFGGKVPVSVGTAPPAPPKSGSRIAPSKVAAAAAVNLFELQADNSQLRADSEALRAHCAARGEAEMETQRSLAMALEREGDLAVLLASAGNSAGMPIDWSVSEARHALQQDAEHELYLDRCVIWARPQVTRSALPTLPGVVHLAV